MKRWIALCLLLGLVLTGCDIKVTPTESDAQIATRVSQILTNMPTQTKPAERVATATPEATKPLQVTVTVTKAPSTPAPQASATQPASTAAPATATQAPATATVVPVTATTAATAVPSATLPATDPRLTLGNPTWRDAMNDGKNWPLGDDPQTEIDFKDGQMVFTGKAPVDGWRLTNPPVVNFYLEMTVKVEKCLTKDRWGMLVRVPKSSKLNQGYLFGINCDGAFALRKWDGTAGPSGTMSTLIDWKVNKAINAGAGKTNRLGLMAKGSKLSLYANGVLLGEVVDGSFTGEGYFGVFSGAHGSSTLTMLVDEMTLWELP